jgi:hypothetical protein
MQRPLVNTQNKNNTYITLSSKVSAFSFLSFRNIISVSN